MPLEINIVNNRSETTLLSDARMQIASQVGFVDMAILITPIMRPAKKSLRLNAAACMLTRASQGTHTITPSGEECHYGSRMRLSRSQRPNTSRCARFRVVYDSIGSRCDAGLSTVNEGKGGSIMCGGIFERLAIL